MVEGIRRYLLDKTAEASKGRTSFWNRDYSSKISYERSVSGNREHLRRIVGAIDERVVATEPESTRGIFDSVVMGRT